MTKRHLLSFALVVSLGCFIWLVTTPAGFAYQRYDPGCKDCHGSFESNTSLKPGNTWPDRKHDVHREQMMTDGLCDTCHKSTDGRNPFLNESDGETGLPGVGCMGCHGRDPRPDIPNNSWWGTGLRLHHANAGVPADDDGFTCVTCHADDPLPFPEDQPPIYYGVAGINISGPCNTDDSENWTSDGLGLDNDGDLDYDTADSDCATAIFQDGFESGDTQMWAASNPPAP